VSPEARAPRFGLFLTPSAASYPDLVRQAAAAEFGGLDLIGIQDHPYQRRFLDTFALIGDLLARTERLTILPAVANLPLRPPATLAKLAASLDVMSGGRFELGLGAGSFWDAIEAMGGPRRSPGESVDALAEAIEIIRRSWSGERSVSFEGRHYRVAGFHPGPLPAHDMGIWIGAYKPRMLDLTGRLGDGWVPSHGYAPPRDIPEMAKRIEDGAARAGRDAQRIRRVYNLSGTIADGPVQEQLHGPPDHWIETLTSFAVELGFDSFIFSPADDVLGQLERFAQEVVPGVREAVAR
jgi:alkanesulfonate monooxygenase SsuD/methylene tetrahydromethanopterin reductase-like flavin-dependent oxidoreductase (luciferase family)